MKAVHRIITIGMRSASGDCLFRIWIVRVVPRNALFGGRLCLRSGTGVCEVKAVSQGC
jgi:hypothetical protein